MPQPVELWHRRMLELAVAAQARYDPSGAASAAPLSSPPPTAWRSCSGTGSEGETGLAHGGEHLEQMARGGIYDQIGGGFCRYSTDEQWLVPHFEKDAL